MSLHGDDRVRRQFPLQTRFICSRGVFGQKCVYSGVLIILRYQNVVWFYVYNKWMEKKINATSTNHVLLYKGCIFTSMYDVAFIMKIMESLKGLLDDALGGGDAKHTLWL